MDFPSWKPSKIYEFPQNLQQALGVNEIVGVYKYRDLLVELNDEKEVINAAPNFTQLKEIGLCPASLLQLPVWMKIRLPVLLMRS
jgi:predicted PhzF superfamily epimerase YddE/YHI9